LSKQDSTFTRTASALEQKYSFGKKFSELLGLIDDTRDRVDSTESSLHNEIQEQYTSIMRDTTQYVSTALTSYVTTDGLESKEEELRSEFKQTAKDVTISVYQDTIDKLTEENGNLTTKVENYEKHFDFSTGGLTIRSSSGEPMLILDNDEIAFIVDKVTKTKIKPNEIETGNIYVKVEEMARFGNYGFVPYVEGEVDGLDLVRVETSAEEVGE
jgi:hypothetical protein